MNILKKIFGKNKKIKTSHKQEVIEATKIIMKRYDKTFKDLAKYDRGEKILNRVSK